ncbi:MAG: DUF1592 domain-containing protein [Verrucomicrobiales bacterium]
MLRWSVLLLLFPICAVAAPDFAGQVLPVVARHCLNCHGEKKQKGGVDFSGAKDTASAMKLYGQWRKAAEQIRSGEMPPDDEPPLPPEDRGVLLGWIGEAFDTTRHPDPGPPLTRQLTRLEYSQTMKDLLRITFDPAGPAGIPEENVVEGFANRAGGLVLEPSLMEKYFTAADLALEYLFTDAGAAGARKSLLGPGPPETKETADSFRRILGTFLHRAYRRPVAKEEIEPFARLADAALAGGDPFEAALRKAMKPALVSPHFLLRLETPVMPSGTVGRVGDHELAVRLSYFLWSTMPDEELLGLADDGSLSQSGILAAQVRRMLADRKAGALTRQFFERWLQLPQLGKALPSQNNFPTFTRSLRNAMEQETRLFCENLRGEDRSILELLDADYTFANAELAKHYGLAAVPGKEFAKVALRPEDHRGGVLGMGSILTMTSHTDRTKPTARGKWILEVLLGTPPPPPPPNAGSFAPPDKNREEPASFREKLAQHASDANCVACHKRIDPLGFAMEDFDAIGSWRSDIGGKPTDNLGHLPGVGEFRGISGLRKVLRDKQPLFVRNAASQILAYALGRELSYYDEPALDRIVTAIAQDDFRFSALIIQVVESFPFQHRKSE